jgi:hypothetical protein
VKEVAELLWSKVLLVVWTCFEVALGDVDDVVNARADLCETQGRRERTLYGQRRSVDLWPWTHNEEVNEHNMGRDDSVDLLEN